jgi:hypothetical protein
VDLSDIAFKEEQPSLVKKISKVILEEISKVRRTKEGDSRSKLIDFQKGEVGFYL